MESFVCWLIWWTCLFFDSVVCAVGSMDSSILMQNQIQTSLRCTYQWGWRATFIACTWMKYAVETTICILLAQLGSTLCGECVSHTWKCVCSTGERIHKPQWYIVFCSNVGCLNMFAVLVHACAGLLYVSAAQRLRIICSRPLVKRKGGCGFGQRRSTENMWATFFYLPYTSHLPSGM